eukprot:1421881-Rhodomonas_salina.1
MGDIVQGNNPADTAKRRHCSRSSSKEPEGDRTMENTQPAMEKILEGMASSALQTPGKEPLSKGDEVQLDGQPATAAQPPHDSKPAVAKSALYVQTTLSFKLEKPLTLVQTAD